MKSKDYISVIVPTKDRKSLLIKCLHSLSQQNILPNEIIVVDNSETQSAEQSIRFLKKTSPVVIKYFSETKMGTTYTRNLGIRVARYDILAFIDDDCIASKNWIEEILKNQNIQNNIVLKGKNLNAVPENIYASAEHFTTESLFETFLYKDIKNIYSLSLDTKNFSVKKSLLTKHNIFFDDNFASFSIFEDLDLAVKLRLNEIKIIYNPKMIVWHYGRKDCLSHFKREFNKGKAYFYFQKKWGDDVYKSKEIYNILKNSQEKKKKAAEIRLRREILKNKSVFFRFFFYLIAFLDKLTTYLGFYFEKSKTLNIKA